MKSDADHDADRKDRRQEEVDTITRNHNARVIQDRLAFLIDLANRAGVSIELHRYRGNEPIDVRDLPFLDFGDNGDVKDGEYVYASPDSDRIPGLRLD